MAKATAISRGKKDRSNIYVLLKNKAVYRLECDRFVYDAEAATIARGVYSQIKECGEADVNVRSKFWRKVR